VVSIIGTRQPCISLITEMELLSSPRLTSLEEKPIRSFINSCIVAGINNTIKEAAIKIRRETSLKLPDSIIAATAISLGFHLLTADTEFNKLKSLYILQYVK